MLLRNQITSWCCTEQTCPSPSDLRWSRHPLPEHSTFQESYRSQGNTSPHHEICTKELLLPRSPDGSLRSFKYWNAWNPKDENQRIAAFYGRTQFSAAVCSVARITDLHQFPKPSRKFPQLASVPVKKSSFQLAQCYLFC